MFNRSRTQLTIRNAAVLSVILIALNFSVYFIMKQMLFERVDQSIRNMSENMAVGAPPMQKAVQFRLGQMDRPIFQLFWTNDRKSIPVGLAHEFTDEQLNKLQPKRINAVPETIKVDGQYYRVFSVKNNSAVTLRNGNDGSSVTIATQQFLTDVSAEMNMLQRLRQILILGGGIGLLIAIAAGYYLANRALVPIRKSLEKQQQFVSDASHELRTPLSVIQAHSELMLRHPDHTIEQDSKHISTVLQEARRMSKLVGGLLTLARSDSNQLELDVRPIQFDRIVQESVRKMEMLAEVKDIILQTEIEPGISMNADEERIHQLLMTLLDNAIKYTPEGGLVRVSCRKLAHSALLEVEDTGIGISADNLPHVFDRFYRGDKARNRQEGGTGLGLAIAKWIVERHGGKIRIESKLSVGTRAFVSLPL